MSKLLFDFLPIALFFVVFKLYGIYAATASAMLASGIQVLLYWHKHHRVDKMHIITFLLIFILGSATLLFKNEIFIKWKPTAINWVLAVLFAASQFIGKKPFIQHLLDTQLSLPNVLWRRLNTMWVVFFATMGAVNLFVVYHFDTATWVNFKLFGMLGLTLGFVLLQSLYLAKHAKPLAASSNEG